MIESDDDEGEGTTTGKRDKINNSRKTGKVRDYGINKMVGGK